MLLLSDEKENREKRGDYGVRFSVFVDTLFI